MKLSKLISKLVKTLSVEGDVDVINIDCDGSVTYNNAAKTEYIDLGLPSGTKWAKCNYGTNNETESGKYYTWDEAKELPITLPTQEQFVELVENTTSKWVENYNNSRVNGRLFISKKNNTYIFIPSAGHFLSGRRHSVGVSGCIWSISFDNIDDIGAFFLYFNFGVIEPQSIGNCYRGFSVRGVSL